MRILGIDMNSLVCLLKYVPSDDKDLPEKPCGTVGNH